MRSWKALSALLAVALLAVGGYLGWQQLTSDDSDDDRASERLITAQVEIRDLLESITINGTLERSEIATINAVAGGQVSNAGLEDGATVSPGDTILAVDGRASIAVEGETPFYRALDVGSEGADVLQLEEILEAAGYSPGVVDTVYTESTRLALGSWQAFYGYPGSSPESNETITVSLSPGTGYSLGPQGSAAAVIGPPAALAYQVLPVAQITTAPTSVAEGGSISITVTIDAVQSTDTVVALSYAGTAMFGLDYPDPGATATIAAGSTSTSVTIDVESDGLVEPDESVVVALLGGAGYTLGAQPATTITIPASGGDPVLTARADTATVAEGAPISFTITASTDPAGDRDVNFAIGGTATNGVDFFAPIGPVLLADTATEIVVPVPTAADGLVEPDETVELIILPGAGYQVGNPNTAAATIVSTNVPEFVLSGGTTVSEGQLATLQITTDQAPGEDVGVAVQVSGDATPGDDYQELDANLIFPAGATSLDIDVQTLVDDVFEEDEDIVVTLLGSQLGSYQVGPVSTQTVTIAAASGSDATPILKIWPDATVTAEGQPASFTVTADREVGQELELNLVFGGVATDGFDVIAPTEVISIRPGQRSVTFQVQTRQDDAVEDDETLVASLGGSPSYRVSLLNSASMLIKSDDVPEIQITGGGPIDEGSSSTFTIFADQPLVEDTTITYNAVGSATPGVDFEPVTGTVLMRAGQQSASVQIATLDDDVQFRPTDMIVAAWPARVGTVLIEEGQAITPGMPLFNLTETEFDITVDVNANDRGDLEVGQEVNVEIDAGNAETTGVIAELDEAATVDPTSGTETYSGRVEIDEQLPAVDGANVRIEVILERRDGAITVPIAAVGLNEEGEESVTVVDIESKVLSSVVVETGLQEGSFIEIIDGLEGNEVVVVEVERS